jgi:hypothetical protein
MPTDKDTRAELPRVFEQYTLSLVNSGHDCGLANIDERAFRRVLATAGGGTGQPTPLSNVLDIGFDFEIDGTTYKKFVASLNGWIALVDPTTGTFSTLEVLQTTDTSVNSSINPTFSSQAVLLAPWFAALISITSNLHSGISPTKRLRNMYGFEPATPISDGTKFDVQYANDCSATQGRRLTVRWNSLINSNTDNSIKFLDAATAHFEVSLYENGTIEFRYDHHKMGLLSIEPGLRVLDGTIGVFMPNGTNRFRDFSHGLGHRDTERTMYRYGGAVYNPTYSEVHPFAFTSSYTCLLSADANWPQLYNDSSGATFVFSPPRAARNVLPRIELASRDAVSQVSSIERSINVANIPYDDRRALMYGMSDVGISYPTTMQRFYGSKTRLVDENIGLFTKGLEVTGSISRIASEGFTTSISNTAIGREFNEATVPTTNPDVLFASSSLEQLGLGMSQPVSAKTKVKLSLAVNNSLIMFESASSIYYYNKATAGWNVPQNSSYVISNGASSNDSGIPRGDIASPQSFVTQNLFPEDARGFNALGGVVSSGSLTPGFANQSSTNIGVPYVRENLVDVLTASYAKSAQVSAEYLATNDELISLPITRPFVIEKIVFELPVTAGPGWFNDMTQAFQPIETPDGSLIVDLAGPALTVSVFNQISPTRRDLIASGTITHTFDNTSNVVFANFQPLTSTYHIRQTGFRAFGAEPAAVIAPTRTSGANNYFTGTVVVPTTAQVSNGVTLFLERMMNFGSTALMQAGVLALFNSPKLDLEELSLPEYTQNTFNAFINGFGRGATGFEPSGRSVFGKEFAMPVGTSVVNNPFYVSGTKGGLTLENIDVHVATGDIPLQFAQSLVSGTKFTAYSAFSLNRCLPSPYLVYPGDKLVIAISKTRPAFYGDATPTPFTSGSILHEVSLMTGTMGVTFYGSHLKEGVEYHETHDAPLNTVSIHETNVGGDPVLDQFEVEYAETYAGGMSDDFVTGSLVDVVTTFSTGAKRTFVVGSRGRIFSRTNADDAGYPKTTSVAYNAQPWFEFAGTTRIAQCTSIERYYDSLMPALDTCFKADVAKLLVADDALIAAFLGLTDANMGFVVLNTSIFGGSGVNNANWARAYPFEPRYSSASRLINIKSSFNATRAFVAGTISPRPTSGLSIVFSKKPVGTAAVYRLFVDSVAPNSTSSMSNDDALKVLYGFGDENTVYVSGSAGSTETGGDNNLPSFRKFNTPFATYSPIIRGWKHGVYSGLPSYSKAYFRNGHFGQFRDMLEQRPYTKYYQLTDINNIGDQEGIKSAVVNVTFVDSVSGSLTAPENTSSSNLSFEVTSSMPYLDGVSRNRPNESLI